MRRRIALAAASGLVYALAQPNWGAWPLAFVAIGPLVLSLREASAKLRFGLGWLAGTLATLLGCVAQGATASAAYLGIPLWHGWLGAILVGQVFGAATFALFTLLLGPGDPGTRWRAARGGSAWVAAELLRSTLLTGLPWLLLAFSVASRPFLSQTAALGGILCPSFLLAAFNTAWATGVQGAGAQRRRAAGSALFWVALLLIPGLRLLGTPGPGRVWPGPEAREEGPGARRIALLHTDWPGVHDASPSEAAREIRRLVELSPQRSHFDLVVWPENAVRPVLPANLALVRRATQRLSPAVPWLLVGAPRSGGSSDPVVRTSALLLDRERSIRGAHDKVRLLPYAESRVPLLQWSRLGPAMRPGPAPRVLDAGGLRVGPLICYEVLFPQVARSSVRRGAELLVNLSNESWFGHTGAAEQLLAASTLQAVALGRPLLRSTNAGISTAIDAWGRRVISRRGEPAGHLIVRVAPGGPRTLYAATGDLLGPVALLASLAAWLAELRSRRRER